MDTVHTFLSALDNPDFFRLICIFLNHFFHIRQIILVCGDINIIKAVYLQHILKGVYDDRLSVHFKKLLRNHCTFHSAAYAACRNRINVSNTSNRTIFQNHCFRADSLYLLKTVRYKKYRHTFVHHGKNLLFTLFPEFGISYRQNLIQNQNFRLHNGRNGKSQPAFHSRRIIFQGNIQEFLQT